MKTCRLMSIILLGVALTVTPVYAQGRGGGGGSRGGGGHSSSSSSHSSSSSSRGGGYSGGHSSSSSSRGSSYSSSSHSSSPRSSSYSSSSSSRSTSYSSGAPSRSHGAPSHSSGVSSGRHNGGSSSGGYTGSTHTRGTGVSSTQHGPAGRGTSHESYRNSTPPASATPSRGTNAGPRGDSPTPVTGRGTVKGDGPRGGAGGPKPGTPHSQTTRGGDRQGDINYGAQHSRYARPGHPGGQMPPSHRPIHPAPYFHHPYHHGMIHMHPIVWHPVCYHPYWYWPGFWVYCNSYWYDYHVTDVVVVHEYVHQQYGVDMVSYAISGDLMYAIVRDGGKTYLQVYDQSDKVIAEHEISSKYIKTEIDRENGGCWVFKKKDKDPLLFLYADGELLIYEAD